MMANTSINRMLQMCPAFTSFKSASSAVWLVARFMWSAMRSLHSVRCGSIAKHSRTGQSLGWRKIWMHNENTSRAGLTASEPVLPHDARAYFHWHNKAGCLVAWLHATGHPAQLCSPSTPLLCCFTSNTMCHCIGTDWPREQKPGSILASGID